MNIMNLYIEKFDGSLSLEKDGIIFSNVSIVRIMIDGEYIDEIDDFSNSLIYFEEMKNSRNGSGNYLIFTCACGIAEDGGWEGVVVNRFNRIVEWSISVGVNVYNYLFDEIQYDSEIIKIEKSLRGISLPLEPVNVIFPLNFHR
ncbi:hypothetical protein [Delftia tsuruhatensis]|uniref:hypothetical protein n=1 Tax=Delftia tsuruhatensis TaxID=180282 RepID=UPI0028AAE1F3|nr:hypothetical protein [Delftia tsuruhatensis]